MSDLVGCMEGESVKIITPKDVLTAADREEIEDLFMKIRVGEDIHYKNFIFKKRWTDEKVVWTERLNLC